MVPGPVQAGAVVAWDDDSHVDDQRRRYRERLTFLAEVLGASGLPVRLPAGGFYLWVPVPASSPGGGWAVTERLALDAGLLVSPGEFYGPGGADRVRVAVVQPRDRLELVAGRLAAARRPRS
jgi:aspartate/methionine/tyrosine aminotransferase